MKTATIPASAISRINSSSSARSSEAFQLLEDLGHPVALDGHAGETDEVERFEGVEVDLLDVLVDAGDLVFGGVSPMRTGRAKTGMFDFLFRSGKPWFKLQNDVGNRGLIKQIRAMRGPWHEESAGERPVVGIGRRIGRASRRASIVVSPATNARCYPRFARDFRADGGFDDRGRSS